MASAAAILGGWNGSKGALTHLQGLEAAGTGSVVFKVVSVYVNILEEFCCDTVVTAFAEVTGADKVAFQLSFLVSLAHVQ